ncbi:SAM-dependent methyltransferase [Mycobacterium tilburgii]|uniref:SAM-dependent methyltransferase n=1 Tax=Mycobacterium tilburgii TaxID=44467 RepID=UPI0021B24B51|nr:SAM-dependent methyltransferase [Mycobacterium tilburgii]
MGRHIHVIGIGAGDPEYVTVQAIEALNDTQVFFAMDKGEVKSDLVGLRRQILRPVHPRARLSLRAATRPEARESRRPAGADYRDAVSDWHAARTRLRATAIATELARRRGRLSGLGRFVTLRQHDADP